jgi:hypothetical protein
VGPDYYAHFTVDSDRVSSSELEELSEDTDLAAVAFCQRRPGRGSTCRGEPVKQGQEAKLWVDTPQLHVFDQETGRSLLASDGSRPAAPDVHSQEPVSLIALSS